MQQQSYLSGDLHSLYSAAAVALNGNPQLANEFAYRKGNKRHDIYRKRWSSNKLDCTIYTASLYLMAGLPSHITQLSSAAYVLLPTFYYWN